MYELLCLSSLISASCVCFLSSSYFRFLLILLFSGAALFCAFNFHAGDYYSHNIFGYDVKIYSIDLLSAFICKAMVLIVFIFSICMRGQKRSESAFFFLPAVFGLFAVMAGDIISLVISHEVLAVAGCILVVLFLRNTDKEVSLPYIVSQLIIGSVFTVGCAVTIFEQGGTKMIHEALSISNGVSGNIGAWMILCSGMAFCGFFPLSSFFTTVYTKLPLFPRISMQIFVIGVGLFTLFHLFAGTELIVFCGFVTAVYAVFLILIERGVDRISGYNMIAHAGLISIMFGPVREFGFHHTSVCLFIMFYIVSQALFLISVRGIVDYSGTKDIRKLKLGFTDAHVVLFLVVLSHTGFPFNIIGSMNRVFGFSFLHFLLSVLTILVFFAVPVRVFYYACVKKLHVSVKKKFECILPPLIFVPLSLFLIFIVLSSIDLLGFMTFVFGVDIVAPDYNVSDFWYSVLYIIPAIIFIRYFPGFIFLKSDFDSFCIAFLIRLYKLSIIFISFLQELLLQRYFFLLSFATRAVSNFRLQPVNSVEFSLLITFYVLLVSLCLVL